MSRNPGRHHVRIWRARDVTIRPWEWRCTCQRWRPWARGMHWSFGEARLRAVAHLERGP